MPNSIQPFKEREINFDLPIKVYRCLNRRGTVFSIQQKGKVVGHTTNISLKEVKFKVNESGKKRAIKSRQRNVHAFVCGYITDYNSELKRKISYFPFNDKGFYFVDTEDEIKFLESVTFNESGLWSN